MSSPFSDDNEVDIDAAWAQIIARWDEEAPPREPLPEPPPAEDGPDDRRPRHAAEVDLRSQQPVRREAAHRAQEPEPYDYERDQLPLGPERDLGPRDVDPEGPSFLDAIGESDEESYEPPPPPPLPRPSLVTGLAWAAAIGGPLFLVFCAMFWREAPSLVVAGAVAAFAGGFVTLVLRMSDHDSDDGAVV